MNYNNGEVAVYYFTPNGSPNILIDIVPRQYFLDYDLLRVYERILPMHTGRTQTINLSLFRDKNGLPV